MCAIPLHSLKGFLVNGVFDMKDKNGQGPIGNSLFPEFIVDHNVAIIDMNDAASNLFGLNKQDEKFCRLGNALKCLHSYKATLGCGYGDDCKKCPVRKSVEGCALNLTEVHGKAQISIMIDGAIVAKSISFTVRPLPKENRFVFKILEDSA
jgi:hypothetical protein